MSPAIEATVKALVQFESELDGAKAEVLEANRKTMQNALDWAEAAKSSALSKAQEIASQRVAKAKEDAEGEASRIRKKGESDLEAFEVSISKNMSRAVELVAARLLGESD
jgi:vacuolar-type H+-ATPase subunit H